MRLLIFSDIHNNLDALNELRRVESNDYDALVVAGDVGNDIAADFFSVADSFECPAFYVHGNWDDEQGYTPSASTRCVLLHHQIETCAGYYFAGFSGHPWAWGKNPDYQLLFNKITEKHSITLERHEKIKADAIHRAVPIEEEFKARGKLLLAKSKRKNLSPSAHRNSRQKLRNWRQKELEKIHLELSEFRRSTTYLAYESDLRQCSELAHDSNRKTLIDLVKCSGLPSDRLILVTHERQHKLADDGIVPLLHVFGHRHRFEFSKFRGSYYLNGASLDPVPQMTETGIAYTPSRYCRVVIEGQTVNVTECILKKNGNV